mmetsp:Transcript_1546/g.3354  ORF Transcript_1546/g.3354 Transcript_1546/m.3354 type:complete len:431 (-) Transcript_1546:175-1467(-)
MEESEQSINKNAPAKTHDDIIDHILSIIFGIFELLFYGLVEVHASFMTAVFTHPDVKNAMAAIMVQGMNGFITQPDLDEKFQIMTDTMAKNQEEAARNAGQEFPKIAGSFIKGMFSKPDHANEKEKKRDIEKKASPSSSKEEEPEHKDTSEKESKGSLGIFFQPQNSNVSSTSPVPPSTPKHRNGSDRTTEAITPKPKEDPPFLRLFSPKQSHQQPPQQGEIADKDSKTENQESKDAAPGAKNPSQDVSNKRDQTESGDIKAKTSKDSDETESTSLSPKPSTKRQPFQWPSPFMKPQSAPTSPKRTAKDDEGERDESRSKDQNFGRQPSSFNLDERQSQSEGLQRSKSLLPWHSPFQKTTPAQSFRSERYISEEEQGSLEMPSLGLSPPSSAAGENKAKEEQPMSQKENDDDSTSPESRPPEKDSESNDP